jgi:hypothetical protein
MKPNVLLFIDSFAQGGTERQVVQLARLLTESGRYRIHLACLSREGVLRTEAEQLGFTDIPNFRLRVFMIATCSCNCDVAAHTCANAPSTSSRRTISTPTSSA